MCTYQQVSRVILYCSVHDDVVVLKAIYISTINIDVGWIGSNIYDGDSEETSGL